MLPFTYLLRFPHTHPLLKCYAAFFLVLAHQCLLFSPISPLRRVLESLQEAEAAAAAAAIARSYESRRRKPPGESHPDNPTRDREETFTLILTHMVLGHFAVPMRHGVPMASDHDGPIPPGATNDRQGCRKDMLVTSETSGGARSGRWCGPNCVGCTPWTDSTCTIAVVAKRPEVQFEPGSEVHVADDSN